MMGRLQIKALGFVGAILGSQIDWFKRRSQAETGIDIGVSGTVGEGGGVGLAGAGSIRNGTNGRAGHGVDGAVLACQRSRSASVSRRTRATPPALREVGVRNVRALQSCGKQGPSRTP